MNFFSVILVHVALYDNRNIMNVNPSSVSS